MEKEDLFDVDVETVICKYINADEVLPFTDYVESDTYDALLRNYHKVKKAYIDAKETIEEQKKLKQIIVSDKFPKVERCRYCVYGRYCFPLNICMCCKKKDGEMYNIDHECSIDDGFEIDEKIFKCYPELLTDGDFMNQYAKYIEKLEKGNPPIQKPPLGVKPCYIQAEERIKDLAEAISRYADRGDYEVVKKWAREICLQCEIAEMEKND